MLVPPQMQLFIHRSCRTRGALAEGEFPLTGALRAFSKDAVAWILVACMIRGSFGGVRGFDETWTGWRNKALNRA